MGVHELRNSFLRAETLSERLRAFRRERIEVLNRGEAPVQLSGGPNLLLHVIPLVAFDPGTQVDVRLVERDYGKLAPLGGSILSHRYNFDGLVTSDGPALDGGMTGYAQLFRTGVVEAVDTTFVGPIDNAYFIRGHTFELSVIEAVSRYLALQQTLGVAPPCSIILSLLGMRGVQMYVGEMDRFVGPSAERGIERSDLVVQLAVEDLTALTDVLLRPAFDAIWNACGHPRSPNYGEDGRWRQRGAS